MGLDGAAYKVVNALHILAVIIGFGTVFLNGLYGRAMERKKGPEAAFMGHSVLAQAKIAEYFIYAVFVLGFAAVLMSDDAWGFDQTWVWLSMGLYVVGIGISHGVLFPNVKRMVALMDELVAMGPPPAGASAGGPPPQAVELEARGRRQAGIEGVLNLIVVVVVVLMVWKPGV